MPLALLLLGGMGILLLASGGKRKAAAPGPLTLIGATKTLTRAGSVWRVTMLISPALPEGARAEMREMFYQQMQRFGHHVVNYAAENVLQGGAKKTLVRMTIKYGSAGEINTGSHVVLPAVPGYVLSVTAEEL
jgi:hypothetical protein